MMENRRNKNEYQTIFIVYSSKGQQQNKTKKNVHISTEGCQHLEIFESTFKTLSPFQPYEEQQQEG